MSIIRHHSTAILTLNSIGFYESQKHVDHFLQVQFVCCCNFLEMGRDSHKPRMVPIHISQLPEEVNKILQVIPVQQTGLYSVGSYFAEKNVDKQGPRGNTNITVSLSHFPPDQGCTEAEEIQ